MSSLKEPYWNPTWWPLALRTKGFTRGGAEYTESLTQDHPCCCFCSFLFLVDRVRRPHTTSMPSNKLKGKNPWTLPFSVGSTLQSSTLKAWLGKEENILKAQAAFLARCKANWETTFGTYKGDAVLGEVVRVPLRASMSRTTSNEEDEVLLFYLFVAVLKSGFSCLIRA